MSYLLVNRSLAFIVACALLLASIGAAAQNIVEVNVRASDGVTYRIPVLKATSESNQRISIQEFYIKDGNGATVGLLDFGIQAELFSASEVAFNAIEVRQVLVDSSDEAVDSLWYELDSTAERISDWQGPIDQIVLSAKSSCQLASSYGGSLAFTSPYSPLKDDFADISGGVLMFLALNNLENCLAFAAKGGFSTFADELVTKIVQVLLAVDQAATKHTLAIEHGVYLNAQVKKLSTYVESETARWLGGGELSISEIRSIGSAMAALTVYTISLWDFSEKMYPESYRIRQQRAEYVKENTQLFINGHGFAAFSRIVPTSAVVELLFGFENILAEEKTTPIARFFQLTGSLGASFIFNRIETRFYNARRIDQYADDMVFDLQLGLEELNPLSARNLLKTSARLEQNLSYRFANVSLSVSASSGMANISGYIETTESAAFSGVVTFNLVGVQFTANVTNTGEGLYFSRNFHLPGSAQVITPRFVSATGVVVDGSSLWIPAYVDTSETSPPGGGSTGGSSGAQKGTSLIFTEVVVRPSSELGGSSDTYQVRGHVRDDAGNNIDGTVRFTIGGTEYSKDLFAGTCGSSSSIDYCKGSFFVLNNIPKPFYTQQVAFSVVSDDGQLTGQTTQLVAGSGGVTAGHGQIAVPNPNITTKWRAGTTHNISYMASGIAPDELIRLWLYRNNGDYVDRVGLNTADRTTRFWQIPADLPEGIYKIRVFQESDPSIEGWSSPFQVVRTNSPPVGRDASIVAVAGEQYLGAISAWDENDDELFFTLAQQPASGNTVTLSGNAFTYLANNQFSGVDSFRVTVSDGTSSTTITVNITVVSPLSIAPYELSSSDIVSPNCGSCMVSHVRTDGKFIYVMSDDGYIRKYTPNGDLQAEVRFMAAIGMDVGGGYVAAVSTDSRPEIAVFNTSNLSKVWGRTNISDDYATDLTIGEGRAFVSFERYEPNRIKFFSLADSSVWGGFAADGRYEHGNDDIYALDFERGSGSASNIVLFSGGRSEDLFQWREAQFQSASAYSHGRGRWVERINAIHAIGNSVYIGGHQGRISKFQSSSSGFTEAWRVSSTNWVNDIFVAGGEVFTAEDGNKLVIRSEADGSVKQIVDLESRPTSVLSHNGVLYVGLINGKLQKFSRNFIPVGTAEKLVLWSNQSRTTQIHVTDLDSADSHSFQKVSAPQHGQATVDAGGLVRYTPASNFYGTDSVSVSVSDGTDSSVVTIPVQVKNRPPVALIESESASIVATVGRRLTLIGRGEDPEGDPIVGYEWSLLGAPESSSAELDSTTTAQTSFTPEIAGVYTVGLRVTDGESYSQLSVIEVSATNFAPQLTVASFSASRDKSSWAVVTTTNKSAEEISSFSIASQAQHGTASISDKGVINYTPNPGYIGSDSFVFRVTDVLGVSSEFEVTFDVENSKPVALGSTFNVRQGSELQAALSGIALGDNQLSFVVQSSPASGQFTLLDEHTGEFSYEAPLAYEGELSFVFIVNDGYADSDPATVTIEVANAAPSIANFAVTEVADGTVVTTFAVQTNGLDTNVSMSYGLDSGLLGSVVNLDPLPGGDEAVAASGSIAGLACGATYYVQLVATNASGMVTSDLIAVDIAECAVPDVRKPLTDFTGTGRSDVMWRDSHSGAVQIWQMNGADPQLIHTLNTVPVEWSIVAQADLDGDGLTDLVWRNINSGEVHVWTMGAGKRSGFRSHGVVPLAWELLGAADIEGQGKASLIWRNSSSGEINIWRMNGLARHSVYVLPRVPLEWKLRGTTDVNADGIEDLVWHNSDTGEVNIWRMGEGRRSGSVIVLGPVTDLNWQIVATGDVDGDGHGDLIWRNGSTGEVHIWRMGENGLKYADKLLTVNLDWQIVGLGDYDGSGKNQLWWRDLTTGENARWEWVGPNQVDVLQAKDVTAMQWQVVSTAVQKLSSAAAAPTNQPPEVSISSPSSGHSATEGTSVVFSGDASDADGSVSAVQYSVNGADWLQASGTTNWSFTLHTLTAGAYQIQVRAVDDDAEFSEVASVSITVQVPVIPAVKPTGDFTGTGRSDVLWRDSQSGALQIWQMNGANPQVVHTLDTVPVEWTIMAQADLNGDGQTDLVWRNTQSGEVHVWTMGGGKRSGFRSHGLIPLDWELLGAADIHGQGKASLIWRNTASGEIDIWMMNGVNRQSVYALSAVPVEWKLVGSGDINGDGIADLVWHNSHSGEVHIWRMSEGRRSGWTLAYGPVTNLDWQIVGVSDLDGDGHADLIWRNRSSGEVNFWRMGAEQIKDRDTLDRVDLVWQIVAVGDYDGSGKNQLWWRNTNTGENARWEWVGKNRVDVLNARAVTATKWQVSGIGRVVH